MHSQEDQSQATKSQYSLAKPSANGQDREEHEGKIQNPKHEENLDTELLFNCYNTFRIDIIDSRVQKVAQGGQES